MTSTRLVRFNVDFVSIAISTLLELEAWDQKNQLEPRGEEVELYMMPNVNRAF